MDLSGIHYVVTVELTQVIPAGVVSEPARMVNRQVVKPLPIATERKTITMTRIVTSAEDAGAALDKAKRLIEVERDDYPIPSMIALPNDRG